MTPETLRSASDGGKRTPRQNRITRGLTVLGLAVAVAGPFGMIVVGVEHDEPLVGLLGGLLVLVVLALVFRR